MSRDQYSFFISARLADECSRVCDEQGFETFSELLNYALRIYRERVLRHEITELRFTPCTKDVEKRVRIHRFLLDDISKITGLRTPEIPEYALYAYIHEWVEMVADPSDFEPEW